MKPAVWVDGGSHAREWIAPAVATWMIHALVEGEKDLGLITIFGNFSNSYINIFIIITNDIKLL